MPVALGLAWGLLWAAFMQFTKVGWFVSTRQTWLGVVLGVGGNLLIGKRYMRKGDWEIMASITAASAMGVAVRSLYNQQNSLEEGNDGLWKKLYGGNV